MSSINQESSISTTSHSSLSSNSVSTTSSSQLSSSSASMTSDTEKRTSSASKWISPVRDRTRSNSADSSFTPAMHLNQGLSPEEEDFVPYSSIKPTLSKASSAKKSPPKTTRSASWADSAAFKVLHDLDPSSFPLKSTQREEETYSPYPGAKPSLSKSSSTETLPPKRERSASIEESASFKVMHSMDPLAFPIKSTQREEETYSPYPGAKPSLAKASSTENPKKSSPPRIRSASLDESTSFKAMHLSDKPAQEEECYSPYPGRMTPDSPTPRSASQPSSPRIGFKTTQGGSGHLSKSESPSSLSIVQHPKAQPLKLAKSPSRSHTPSPTAPTKENSSNEGRRTPIKMDPEFRNLYVSFIPSSDHSPLMVEPLEKKSAAPSSASASKSRPVTPIRVPAHYSDSHGKFKPISPAGLKPSLPPAHPSSHPPLHSPIAHHKPVTPSSAQMRPIEESSSDETETLPPARSAQLNPSVV